MKNLLDQKTFDQCKNRLELLNPESTPLWGKMKASQMFHHCQKPLEVALQKKDYDLKSNIVAKWFFKKMMYNDTPWTKGMRTPKAFKVEEGKNWGEERKLLLQVLDEFFSQREKKIWPKHPVFGQFSPEQVGKMQFKHLDHHLKQFGV